jgi:hypothetical protein
VACQSGSLGTNSPGGKFKTIGKTVFFTATLGITTNSTCAGNMTFTLPVTAAGGVYQIGGVNQTTGVAGVCVITPSNFFMFCNKYDGTYLGGDGNVLAYTGIYVSQ